MIYLTGHVDFVISYFFVFTLFLLVVCDLQSVCFFCLQHQSPFREYNLYNLPPEVFTHICYYLDSITIFNLKKVCTAFNGILSDEYFWKKKARIDYPETTLIQDDDDNELQFSHMLYEVDKNKKFLEDIGSDKVETVNLKDVHKRCVKEIKFIHEDICVSVSNDNSIALWNVTHSHNNLIKHYPQAHNKGVCCIDVFDDKTFCTGSWDKTIKVWSPDHLTAISTYQCRSEPVTISCENSLIAAGLVYCELLLYDIRQKSSKIFPGVTVRFSTKPSFGYGEILTKVTLDQHCVYVTNKDGTISCFDLRTQRNLKSIDTIGLDNPSQCLEVCEYYKGTLVAGYTDGTVVIFNKNLEELTRKTLPIDMDVHCDFTKRNLHVEGFTCIKMNEYDLFVGATVTEPCFMSLLKSNPIIPLFNIGPSKENPFGITAMDYSLDRALLWGTESGDVIINKKVDNTISI